MLLYSLVLILPPALLIACGLIPGRWANRHVQVMRSGALVLLALAFCGSLSATALLVSSGPLDVALIQTSWPIPLNLGVYFDSLAAVMLLLISFIGLIIARYSVRYLAGEATQGRFLRWILFTLGSVLLLILSRNLVMFTAAWMMTSLGLHQLLIHYSDRPWAVWAARKKFLISRLGDLFLIGALVLTWHCFGTFDYSEVFAAAQLSQQALSASSSLIAVTGLLLAFGAMTKSAQFPFHTWLPDTMETPTPVSSLMHAGIINAGGFLVIRLSPLVSTSPAAMELLAVTGAFTALFGGVVMLTQTSVKRSLAYSTMAQMGFMMLQCGLGAYSAALLHIVAHSLYKAHAFLSSGSTLDTAAQTKSTVQLTPARNPFTRLPAACITAVVLSGSLAWMSGIDLANKQGAGILGFILVLALTHVIWRALATDSWRLATRGIGFAALSCACYLAGFLLMDRILASTVSIRLASPSAMSDPVTALVMIGFLSAAVLQAAALSGHRSPRLKALYVHAMHGFYLDIPARRLTAMFWGRATPAP